MEFRIAPMIMAFVNLLLILVVNPDLNPLIPLKQVANVWKILIPFMIIMAMSIGSFSRHSYYSRTFKTGFFILNLINLALAVYYVYAIREQHLGY